jgi:hypothetical protein
MIALLFNKDHQGIKSLTNERLLRYSLTFMREYEELLIGEKEKPNAPGRAKQPIPGKATTFSFQEKVVGPRVADFVNVMDSECNIPYLRALPLSPAT